LTVIWDKEELFMGKYSLENYYPYETYKIRPEPLPEAPVNIGRGEYSFLEYTWEELEPGRGNYSILVIKQDPPSWLKEAPSCLKDHPEECFAHLIRRVGSSLAEEQKLVGVVITSAGDSIRTWDAYLEAFGNIPILAELENEKLIRYLKGKGHAFGLLVKCSENNWIDCCEKFAEHQLQNTWERMPVILQITEKAIGPNIHREGLRWHAGFANRPIDLGYNFTLRRMTYPKKIVGNGALPIRFWFVNTGSASCYKKFQLKLKLELQLESESTHYEFLLHTDQNAWKIDDITHNEILPLPELQEGSYLLSVGMFFPDGTPIHLDLQAKEKRGYYVLGTIEVDNSRTDDLYHSWDDFYPEGYYPLEDPQAPNEIDT
jgi:hypothetical protein